MSSPSLRIRRHLLPVTIVAAVTALALTGCEPGVLAPTETPEPSASATVTPEPSEPAETPGQTDEPGESEAPEPSDSTEPTTPPVAGELPCTDVFTADQLYAFNPNFAPSSEQGQLPGVVADIADAGGTVCAYQHVTSADRLVIGVLQGMGDFNAPGFESVSGVGVASTQSDDAVIAVASVYFEQDEQYAQQVLDEVGANLG